MNIDLTLLSNVAIEAALAAAKIIQKYMDEEVEVCKKEDVSSEAAQVVTKVDKECETEIIKLLHPSCEKYEIALLSEERDDDGSRFEKDFFWCIDPMDGTLPFIKKQPGFSVSIALVAKDGTPCIGVVFDPSTEVLYHAIKGGGAFKNRSTWNISRTNDYLTYVTDKRLVDTPRADEIINLLKSKSSKLNLRGFQEMAGAGSVVNAIRVLENGPACMFKFPKQEDGGGSIWDFAATACIYDELGLQATNFGGEKLDLNKRGDSFMNHEGVFYANL